MSLAARFRRARVALATLTLVFLALAPRLFAEEPQWAWTGVKRIVAVGDVHGAYDNLVAVLKNAGLVDDHLDWIGGETHLVQNGDMLDRGPDSRKVMDLYMDLQEQAPKKGGYVHVILGNHEAMNIVGILDLVSEKEFESYTDRDSRRRRELTFERYYEQVRKEAREKGEDVPHKNGLWKQFQQDYPLGYVEHRQAFSKNGRYGSWLLGLNAAIKINDVVFTHGDWNERFSEIGIARFNESVRKELAGEAPLESGLTFDSESPLQYRGLANVPLTRAAQSVEKPRVVNILRNLQAKRMVVGHTVTSGVIESRFDGGHVSIDTGMLEIYHGGHRIALEIEGEALRAIHDGGKVDVPERMDETNYDDYIRAVAAVDPTNLDVQLELADQLRDQGHEREAVALIERLMERSRYVPFRYHELLGMHYEALGDRKRAREHYEEYVEGLNGLVEATPDNLNLTNLLARFCIDKGVELDLAERSLARILEAAPGNASFRLTQTRLLLAKDDFRAALELVEDLPTGNGLTYDVHYLEGLAYLGLEQPGRAREAFERAIESEPRRKEAREELEKLESRTVPN